MAGLGIRLYTDEMIPPFLARTLRQLGYDAVSCIEVGRGSRGISDQEQLAYATQENRAIFTFDVADFVALDARCKDRGIRHAGIIVSLPIVDLGNLLHRVQYHLDTSIHRHRRTFCSGSCQLRSGFEVRREARTG